MVEIGWIYELTLEKGDIYWIELENLVLQQTTLFILHIGY